MANLWLRKDRTPHRWYISDHGQKISTGHTNRKLAERVLAQYMKNRAVGLEPPTPLSKSLGLYEAWQVGTKEVTRRDREAVLRRLIAHAGDKPVDRITPRGIEAFITAEHGRGLSNARLNTTRSYLNHFFVRCLKRRYVAANPVEEADLPKFREVQGRNARCLEQTAIDRLFDLLAEEPDVGMPRDAKGRLVGGRFRSDPGPRKDMALLALNTGLRIGEIVHLEWTDLDFDRGQLRVQAKPDWAPEDYECRTLEMSPPIQSMLRERVSTERALSPFVFPDEFGKRRSEKTEVRWMNRAFAKAGLGSGGWHVFRHTFATCFVEAGGSMEALVRVMGHSTMSVTRRYVHVRPEYRAEAQLRVQIGPGRENFPISEPGSDRVAESPQEGWRPSWCRVGTGSWVGCVRSSRLGRRSPPSSIGTASGSGDRSRTTRILATDRACRRRTRAYADEIIPLSSMEYGGFR